MMSNFGKDLKKVEFSNTSGEKVKMAKLLKKIVKTRKQPKWSSTDKQVNNLWST